MLKCPNIFWATIISWSGYFALLRAPLRKAVLMTSAAMVKCQRMQFSICIGKTSHIAHLIVSASNDMVEPAKFKCILLDVNQPVVYLLNLLVWIHFCNTEKSLANTYIKSYNSINFFMLSLYMYVVPYIQYIFLPGCSFYSKKKWIYSLFSFCDINVSNKTLSCTFCFN